MTFNKRMAVLGGMVAMVGTAYVGMATVAPGNVAIAKEAKVDMSQENAKLGYTIGVQIATDMKRSKLNEDISLDALTKAFNDVFADKELALTPEQMQAAQVAYQEKKQAEYEGMLAKNAEASAAYVTKNGAEKGVTTTDSGLQYQVMREGKGKQPTASDSVKVHYQGTLIDGTQFDSSYDRGAPATFGVSGVIPGFSEGLQLMKEGGKYRFVIPADQAYGVNAPPSIGPNQALIFDVELIEVVSQGEEPQKKEP